MKQERLRCLNTYCKGVRFTPIIVLENGMLEAIKCMTCGAIYDETQIMIKPDKKREGKWNSYKLRSIYK